MKQDVLSLDPMDFGCQQAKVVAINVQPGHSACEGDALIEFECDKASFELSMPGDGNVDAILVAIGDTIEGSVEVARVAASAASFVESDVSLPVGDLAERYPLVRGVASRKEAVQILNQSVRIGAASKGDALSLAKVYVESSSIAATGQTPKLTDESVAWFEREILNPRKHFLKCELCDGSDASEIIGHCNIERIDRTPEICYHFIGLYVAAPHLPWTSATQLMSAAIAHCQTNGIDHLFGITHATNAASIKLLMSTGFTEIASITDGNYQDKTSRFFEMQIP